MEEQRYKFVILRRKVKALPDTDPDKAARLLDIKDRIDKAESDILAAVAGLLAVFS